MTALWAFLRFHQPATSTVAIGVVLRPPATTNRDGGRFVKRQYARRDAGALMRTVTKRQVLAPGTAAIGDLLRYLLDDRRFDQIFVK